MSLWDKVKKIYKPIGAIEKNIIRPIGKKIPIVGDFARLHESVTEPLAKAVIKLAEKPKKSKAEALATIATSKSSFIAQRLKKNGKAATQKAINTVRANAGKALKAAAKSDPHAKSLLALTQHVTAANIVGIAKKTGVPVSPNVAAALKNAAASLNLATPTGGVYTVIKPDGSRVTIPASQVR